MSSRYWLKWTQPMSFTWTGRQIWKIMVFLQTKRSSCRHVARKVHSRASEILSSEGQWECLSQPLHREMVVTSTRTPQQIACRHNFSKWRASHVVDVNGGRNRTFIRFCRLCAVIEKIVEERLK